MAPPASPPQAAPVRALQDRLSGLGHVYGAREAEHATAMEETWSEARRVHERVSEAIGAFHVALAQHGSRHLGLVLGEPRLDEKHVRAVQFEIARGRTVALITVKSRGDVTLVGPFRVGKTEGPCQSLPWSDAPALDDALGTFLERFLEQAMTP